MSDYIISVILGIVEGLTEFLPVSSTGHLILVGNYLGFTGPRAESFEIFIQSGAILAVIVLYSKYFLNLLNFSKGSSSEGFSGFAGLTKLAVGALPVFILGFVLHRFIKEHLFSPTTVAIGLIVGGLAILIIEKKKLTVTKTKVSDLSLSDCLKIGLIQCLALWPGVSRSGATIIGGLCLGFERKVAAEFSFILAVPVLLVACAYDLLKSYKSLAASDFAIFAIGFLVSFVTALLTIRIFISLVQRYNFIPFAYYRFAIGIIVLLSMT